MRIPIFISTPTALTEGQQASRDLLWEYLAAHDLEPRAIGKSDYPTIFPLREILAVARHCSGGLILGFEQFRADEGVSKPGTDAERAISAPVSFPTPWNQLEAGIVFGQRLPLLVLYESAIKGGIFDDDSEEFFVQPMPGVPQSTEAKAALDATFAKWVRAVRARYYDAQPPMEG